MFDLLFSIISVTLGIFKDVDVDPKRFKNEAGVSMFVARGGGDDVGIVHGQCDAVGKVAVFEKGPRPNQPSRGKKFDQSVREVFIIHVGGTRCVTSSIENITKRHARITLTVEVIRTCIFLF